MKKIISILLVVLMLGGSFAMVANAGVGDNLYTEKETNNTAKDANLLYNDYTVSGVVADKDDLDYYKISLSKETQISFLCQSRHNTVAVSLRDSANNVLLNAESDVANDNYYDIIVATLAAGTYYFVVSQNSTYSNVPYLFYYEEIKSADHTHKYVVTETKPTCTEPSYKTYYCACKFNFVTAGDPPTGHWESTWLDFVPATCQEEGTMRKNCITCGANLGLKTTSKTAHTDKNADGWCDTCDLTYDDCSCLCHRDDLIGVFFNAILKILKVFKIAETCACGFAH
ncbi:MAG: hypothetical protein J6V06_05250 [Clostridia bacterium]|nr:hypothetical protein [Clostridia bacterium]MBO7319409.1 hypothetical protein [Clostridia bacterium]